MDFNHQQTYYHTPPITFTPPPPPPPPNVSDVPHQPLSGNMGWGYNGSNHLEGPNSAIEMSMFIRREMEKGNIKEDTMMETVWTRIQKERIREDIIVDEIVRRRLLEAEVRRELSRERELAFHRGGDLLIDPRGFHAPLSPLDVGERSIEERFVTSLEGRVGEWEGRPLGERFVSSREGEGRPVGEGFATSLDGRVGMPSMLRRESGGLGTGMQRNVDPHISEVKLHSGNGKQKEKVILPAKPLQDANACVVPSAGIAKKQLTEEWSCALCQVSSSSEQDLNEHLQGKRHKAKEAGLMKKANKFKVGWFTEKTPIVSRKDAPLMSTKASKRSYKTIAKSAESGSQSQDPNNSSRKDYSSVDYVNNNEAVAGDRKNSPGKKNNICKFWRETCKVKGTFEVMEEHGTEMKHSAQLQISNHNSQVLEGVQKLTVTETVGNDEENSASKDLSDGVPKVDLEDSTDLVHKVELEGQQKQESKVDAKTSHDNSQKSGDPLIRNHQLDDCARNSGTPIVRTQYNKNSLKFWCETCQIGTDTEKVMKIHLKGKKHFEHRKNLLRYWCDVCQIGADTEEVMEIHWKGKNHLSRLWQINKKPGDETLKLTTQPIQDAELNLRDTRNKYNLIKNRSQFSVESLKKNGAPVRRIKVSQELKKNSLKFWCEMCQIGTDTEEVMKIHRSGKKHLANKKNLLRFWCDVCQIGADTKEVMEIHCKGKKHLSQLQERQSKQC